MGTLRGSLKSLGKDSDLMASDRHSGPVSEPRPPERSESTGFWRLLGVNFSHGYAGKISRYLDATKKRFSGMKFHYCHMLMTQILPVAIRGLMDEHVRDTLLGLCNFFDVINRKSIGVRQLHRL